METECFSRDFCLQAPGIAGGNTKKILEELITEGNESRGQAANEEREYTS